MCREWRECKGVGRACEAVAALQPYRSENAGFEPANDFPCSLRSIRLTRRGSLATVPFKRRAKVRAGGTALCMYPYNDRMSHVAKAM